MLSIRPSVRAALTVYSALFLSVSGVRAVTGPITGYTVWNTAGSPYTVTGDITVGAGDTLVIEPGVRVEFTAVSDDQAGGRTPSYSEILVQEGGRLFALGTDVDSVVFTGTGTNANEWYGITVSDSAAARLSRCAFSNGYFCVFGNYTTADTILVERCSFSNSWYGVQTNQNRGAVWRITDNQFIRVNNYAVSLQVPYLTTIADNYFDCTGGSFGINLHHNSTDDSSCLVTGNTLLGDGESGTGISTDYLRPTITGNTISGFKYGLYYDNFRTGQSYPPVSGNRITGGIYGITLDGNAVPAITGNSIYGQSQFQVRTLVPDSAVDARGNWWGDATTAEIEAANNPADIEGLHDGFDDDTYGFIDYSGWLDAEGGSPVPTAVSGTLQLVDTGGLPQLGFETGDTVRVRVADADLDADSLAADAVTVYLATETEAVPEALQLTETGAATGVFTGMMVLDDAGAAAADGMLQATKGDTVRVTYYEARNKFYDADTVTDQALYGVTRAAGALDGRTVWTKAASPYLLTSDVTVGAWDTLEIEPGVTVLFGAGRDDGHDGGHSLLSEIYLDSYAHLHAVGTPEDSIRFLSTAAKPEAGDWYGIYIRYDASARIRNCVLENAYYAVRGSGTRADSVVVRGCRISHADIGVYSTSSYDGVHWVVDSCRITDMGRTGVHFTYLTHLAVTGNYITSAEDGIYLYNSRDVNDSSITVTGNTVVGSGIGSGHDDGMYVINVRPDIEDNTVSYFNNGLYLTHQTATSGSYDVRNNDISAVANCVYVRYTAAPKLRNNALHNYQSSAVRQEGTRDLDCRNNWWNTEATALIETGGNPQNVDFIYDSYDNASYGTVDYSRWLDAPGGTPATGEHQGRAQIADNTGSAPAYFTNGDDLYLEVNDPDLDVTGSADLVTVYLASEVEIETLQLAETGASTGVFRLTVALDESATPLPGGVLQALPGDRLLMTYFDAADVYGRPDTLTARGLYEPVTVSGPVSGNEVWDAATGPYVVTGDVTIPGGASLTIRPGTEVRFAPHQDDRATGRDNANGEITVISSGLLHAVGTPDSHIVFTSAGADPAAEDWENIYANGGGRLRLAWCDMSYAYYCVYPSDCVAESITVRHCTFTGATDGVHAVRTGDNTTVVIDSCRFTGNVSRDISLYDVPDAMVTGNTFDSDINYCVTVSSLNDTGILIENNTFNGAGHGRGIACSDSRPRVRNNVFNDWGTGVECRLNDISEGLTHRVTGNVFNRGLICMSIQGDAQPTVSGNSFMGQEDYAIYLAGSGDVDARGNWWGAAVTSEMAGQPYPANISAIYDYKDYYQNGNVWYFGWLDAPGGTPVDSAFSGTLVLTDAAGADRLVYAPGQDVHVRVADRDLDTDHGSAETVTVLVSSSRESAPETLVLTETGPATGVFTGSITVSSSAGDVVDGMLYALTEDRITAVYTDIRNKFGVETVCADEARYGITAVSGDLDGRVTWSAARSPYLVTGDVIIGTGDTLVIDPGVTVYFVDSADDQGTGNDDERSELYVTGGHLAARGSATQPVYLRSFADSASMGSWYGITAANDASILLDSCVVEHAAYAVYLNNTSTGSVTVRNSRFLSTAYAMYVGNGSGPLEVTGNHMVRPFNGGVYLNAVTAPCLVADNVIDTCGGTAIGVQGGLSGPNITICGNTVTGALRGIYISQGKPTVTGNTVTECGYGIYCHEYQPANAGEYDITENTVTGGTYGFYLQGYVIPRIHRNVITGQSGYQVYSKANTDVDCRFNWWGAATTDSMAAGPYPRDIAAIYDHYDDGIYGLVHYYGWLDTAGGNPSDSAATGTIVFTDAADSLQYAYSRDDTIYIRLSDADADTDPLAADTLVLYVLSGTEQTPESVTVIETGTGTGVFAGAIALDSSATSASDGVLQAVYGDLIVAVYHDAMNGFGLADTTRERAAFMATFVSGRLAGRHFWHGSGSPYIVTGDIQLLAGDELTIGAGTGVYLAAGSDDQSAGQVDTLCEFDVNGGMLHVAGTPAAPVLFTSLADTQAVQDWYGIGVRGAGRADLAHATIRFTRYPVYAGALTGAVSLRNVRISEGVTGIFLNTVEKSGSVLIDSCRVVRMNDRGLFATYGRNCTVSNSVFDSLGGDGMYWTYPYTDIGSVVRGNTVRGRGAGAGIYASRCQVDVAGNTVVGWTQGIRTSLGSSSYGQQQTITGNTVIGGTYGVFVESYAAPVVTGNALYGQSSYQLYNSSASDIDARMNYWGTAATAEMNAGGNPKNITGIRDRYDNTSAGTVNYSAWLDTAFGTPTILGVNGTVALVRPDGSTRYGVLSGDTVLVQVVDPDLNIRTDAADSVTVGITSTSEFVPEPLVLHETGVNTGIFAGGIAAVTGPVAYLDGTVQGAVEDRLTARYMDATDDYGNPDTVTAGCLLGVREVSGALAGVTHWTAADGPYLVTGDITVLGTGTRLEIGPGTRVLFQPRTDLVDAGTDEELGEIVVDDFGRVRAVGTDSLRITFASAAARPAESDWFGFNVRYTGGLNLEYCDISHADIAVYAYVTNTYPHTVRSCTITDSRYGIRLYQTHNDASWDISGNRISGTSSYGFYGTYLSRVNLAGNTFDSTGNHTISLSYELNDLDSTVVIADNTLKGTGSGYAIYCRELQPTVTGNRISRYSNGMYFDLSSETEPHQTVSFNTFDSCTAFLLDDHAAPTVRYNNFIRESGNVVQTMSARDTDFRYNWWGTARTAHLDTSVHPADQNFILDSYEDASYGTIDYADWLPEPATRTPVVTSSASDTAYEDVLFKYGAAYYDLDDAAPALTVSGLPGWLSATGDTVSGTPDEDDGDTSFVLVVSDGVHADTHRVRITVVPVNDPPAVTSAAADTATEDVPFAYTASASDPDNTPVLSFANLPGWLSVTGATVYGTPAEGDTAVSFSVIASDGEYADTLAVALAVTPVNDPPMVTSAPAVLVLAGETFRYVATASDPDDTPVLSIAGLAGWLSPAGDTVTGTVDSASTDTVFTVVAFDGEYADTLVVTVTVRDSNRAPVISSAAADTAVEDVPYTYIAAADDADGDAVFAAFGDIPAWLTAVGDTLYGTPVEGVGDTSFTVIVSDGRDADTLSVALTVTPVNDRPVVMSPAADTAYEDVPFRYVATAADPDGTPLIQFVSVPSWAYASGDTVIGTPVEGVSYSEIVIAADDGAGVPGSLTVGITVVPENDPPVITSSATVNAVEDELFAYTVTVTDPDDASPAVTVAGLPDWLGMTGKTVTGLPREGDDGVYVITVTATDGEYADTLAVTVNVAAVNDPPLITSAVTASSRPGSLFVYQLTFTDPDDIPAAGFNNLPGWLSVTGNAVFGIVPAGAADTSFTAWVHDGEYGDTVRVALDLDGTGSISPVPFGPDGGLVFENPVRNMLRISGLGAEVRQVTLYDATGSRVLQQTVSGNSGYIQIDLRMLPGGTYVLRVTGGAEDLFRKVSIR